MNSIKRETIARSQTEMCHDQMMFLKVTSLAALRITKEETGF